MRNKKLLIVSGMLCLALIVMLLPAMSACGPATEKTLKIGMSTPSSGPAAEKGSPMGHANIDCFKYINEELGGVAGYQVEVLWLDNAYDASKAATIIKRFMDEDCLFFTTASSTMMTAMMEIANRDEFPGFACFSSPALTHPPRHINIFTGRHQTTEMTGQLSPRTIWKTSGMARVSPRWHYTCSITPLAMVPEMPPQRLPMNWVLRLSPPKSTAPPLPQRLNL